ncbi:glycosyltransferase [Peribacillus loiseleuriae]|uniref:Glycosyl transferase family 2 n=1 Tax=Peribacillus loiseleuriae TaxID=1679170 RepID=A0A0K9GYT3_9BACI|nr:glycosyltransferase [Peribacillus loiseleuriae]KMY51889.1 glycosyl transferase family 2 [Peribacillus loiseleuriae]
MSIKVSVIIPVYNAEKYVAECIESLISQTLQDCEFIFINDGSKDRSGEMIEHYQKLDNRIILINQGNQGVSMARNAGLHIATGEYIGFVDADDYIENDMYERLYHSAKYDDCDVVISNFESEMDGHKVITKYPFPIDTTLKKNYIEQELLPYFIKADNLNSVVNKLFRNELIKEQSIGFPEKVALGEDGLFNIRFFSYAFTVKYLEYAGYHYREVAGSATRNIAGKDYFNRSLEVYNLNLPDIFTGIMNKEKLQQLKSIKLVNNVMSYIHLYLKPSQDISFSNRYKYVKNMICNKDVKEALFVYYNEVYHVLGRYEKFIVNMMKRKSIIGLYCATAYSRFRNK